MHSSKERIPNAHKRQILGNMNQKPNIELITLDSESPKSAISDNSSVNNPRKTKHVAGRVSSSYASAPLSTVIERKKPKIEPLKTEKKPECISNPVFERKQEIFEVLRTENLFIVIGDQGTGKTTKLPQVILEGNFAEDGPIVITQPRMSCISHICESVAKDLDCAIGETVGYSLPFDSLVQRSTKIIYTTDEMLFNESMKNTSLKGYSWIIIDEIHERSIYTDLLLNVIKGILSTEGVKTKVILCGDIIDIDQFYVYFNGDISIFEITGRSYSIEYLTATNSLPESEMYPMIISTIVNIHFNECKGDILVFLADPEEILTVMNLVKQHFARDARALTASIECLPLFDNLPLMQLQSINRAAENGARKIVFATSIAETSISIPNVKYVIDSCRKKSRAYDPAHKAEVFKSVKISKAEISMRSIKARCKDRQGHYCQMYSKEVCEALLEFPVPEIQRSNLARVTLLLAVRGNNYLENVDLLDMPDLENIEDARTKLYMLGALGQSEDGESLELTSFGKILALFPIEPFYAYAILVSNVYQCTMEILKIVSMLVSNVFLHGVNRVSELFATRDGDHVMLLNIFNAFEKGQQMGKIFSFRNDKYFQSWCERNFLSWDGLTRAVSTRDTLANICESLNIPPDKSSRKMPTIKECLARAFVMSSAQLLDDKTRYGDCYTKQELFLHPQFYKNIARDCPKFVVYTQLTACDIQGTTTYQMRFATPVEKKWLKDAVKGTEIPPS